MVDPPKPRFTGETSGKSEPRVFHRRMLEEPRNITPPGDGGWARSAASKASISFWKGWEVGLVVALTAGWVVARVVGVVCRSSCWAGTVVQEASRRQRAKRGGRVMEIL